MQTGLPGAHPGRTIRLWNLQALAEIVLAVHLVWIVWVILGAVWTRGYPFLTGLHIASLVWGILVELTPWPCPLTLLEQFFESAAGISPYRGPFLLHYLDAIVYPHVSEYLLVYLGVAVCAINLVVYLWRLRRFVRSR